MERKGFNIVLFSPFFHHVSQNIFATIGFNPATFRAADHLPRSSKYFKFSTEGRKVFSYDLKIARETLISRVRGRDCVNSLLRRSFSLFFLSSRDLTGAERLSQFENLRFVSFRNGNALEKSSILALLADEREIFHVRIFLWTTKRVGWMMDTKEEKGKKRVPINIKNTFCLSICKSIT